jgi:hypothetical protein
VERELLILGEALLLAAALAAALSVKPWRLLQGKGAALATPLLGALVVVPWLWSWPGLSQAPIALQWSAAPLVVLLLGWPLAVPLLVVAGFSTMITQGSSWIEALSLTAWWGLIPATVVLALGHGVRRAFGAQPLAYIAGRAFFVPMLTLLACSFAAASWDLPFARLHDGDMGMVAALLMSLGEASWTCALVTLLVAYRPQWLATWSEKLYLPRPQSIPSARR